MTENPWHDCVKDPSETGKKVLCEQNGDLYVAQRFEKYYIPLPFADHYFSKDLCFPTQWQEINFPNGLTGILRIYHQNEQRLMSFSEWEQKYPKEFKKYIKNIIDSIGTIKSPEPISNIDDLKL